MPIAPADLFKRIELSISGTVPWGDIPGTDEPGVYAVSLCNDPKRNAGLLAQAPIDLALVGAWIARVPTFTLRGQRALAADVASCLKSFWLPDESIIYIGKANCLSSRLMQYRGHKLGNRSPHAGGHWLKTLSNLRALYIHYCICTTKALAIVKEDEALSAFKKQVSPSHRARISNPIPFANRAHPENNCKQEDIRGDVLR